MMDAIPPAMPTRPTRILLVDDYEESREIFKELLELGGFQASTAKDGWEALAWMSSCLMPIVIIDEDLPDFAGAALSIRLKAVAARDWHRSRCLTMGLRADAAYRGPSALKDFDYLQPKPLDYPSFDAAIEQCVADLARRPRMS